MKIRLKAIGPEGRRAQASVQAVDLPLLSELSQSEGVGFPEPVAVDIMLIRQPHDVVVAAGTLDTRAVIGCGRCLEPTTVAVHSDVHAVFEPASAGEAAAAAVVELTAADMERTPYDGDSLDLGTLIQEEILAALPLKVLCRDDCKGLCPACGANLNAASCGCDHGAVDPRLAALKNWRPE